MLFIENGVMFTSAPSGTENKALIVRLDGSLLAKVLGFSSFHRVRLHLCCVHFVAEPLENGIVSTPNVEIFLNEGRPLYHTRN